MAFGKPAAIEAVIDRLAARPAPGPALPGLDEAARGHTLVVGARSPVESFAQVVVGPPGAGDLPPEVVRAAEPFRGTEAVVTLDLLPPAGDCPLPGADVAARIRYPTADEAARAVDGIRGSIRERGKPDPRPITAGPAVLLPALLKAAREADVRQDGAEVVVTGGPRWTAADWVAVARKPVPTTEEKLHQIGLALHAYNDTYKHFPPPVIRAEEGRALYSWRVELLPFLKQDELYRKVNRKEAWDHPDNKALLDKVPDVFAMSADDPAHSATGTRFQALVGKGGVFDPTAQTRWAGITDGTSDTVLLVEAGEPVHWAAPRDVEYKVGDPLPKLGLPGADTVLLLVANGSTKRLPRSGLRAEDLSALFTRAGNETVDWARLERGRKGK